MIVYKRHRSRRLMAEINVTPMVDVMLVLLIVFMVTAPLLVTGVAIDLPKTKTRQLPASQKPPLTVTVGAEGQLYIGGQKDNIPPEQLAARLKAIVTGGYRERIYVRGDRSAAYGNVMQALSLLQGAGFGNVALITDSRSASDTRP